MRLLDAPYRYAGVLRIGDMYLGQFVAPARGTLSVVAPYELRSTNENCVALMQGWVGSELEHSRPDAHFGHASLSWYEAFPMSGGSGEVVVIRQYNRDADPIGDHTPVLSFTSHRKARRTPWSSVLAERGLAHLKSKTRFEEDVPVRTLETFPSFYIASLVAPVDGEYEVDYKFVCKPTHPAAEAEVLLWLNGNLDYHHHDRGFGAFDGKYEQTLPLKKGEIMSMLVLEYNSGADPTFTKKLVRFRST